MRTRFVLALLVVALAAPGCVRHSFDTGKKPLVVTGLYPLQEVALQVGGDLVVVSDLAQPGAEPHDIELSPAQVGEVERADVVLHVRGLQPALDSAITGDAGLDALAVTGGDDPHVWLDPELLGRIALELAARLTRVDPEHGDAYNFGASELIGRLGGLGSEIAAALSQCRRRDLVTTHAAFGRFAARFGLRETSASGIDPEAEPSPRRIAEVAAFARKHGVTTVFAESLGDKTAQTVAREAGAKVAVLDPVEVDRGEPYDDVMRKNVTVLREALGCP